MIRRPPRSTLSSSSAASDVYKRQEVPGVSAEPIRIPVPVESPSVVFDVVGRGYDRRQVHEQLHRQEQELAELRWELEALQAERDSVREDRARLNSSYDGRQ